MSELILDGNWYKKAKEELKDKKWRKEHLHGSAEFTWHMEQYITLLESVMLAYRREHGIFEVGDKVIYLSLHHDPYLNVETVVQVDNENITLNFGSFPVKKFRHATDEEIAAGHRL